MENEQIDIRIKALVKPECLIQDPPPPPPITDLVYPQLEASITPSYNTPVRIDGGWGVYGVNRKLTYYNNDWGYKYDRQTNAPAGSVILVTEEGSPKYFGRQHFKSAFNADYESRYYKSADGVSWYNTFLDRAVQGEDANMIQSLSSYVWNFIRPSRIRDLAVQTLTTDVSNNNLPSRMKTILAHNTSLALGKDVYCACPIIVEDGVSPKFLLFVSLYRKGDLGQDVEQLPPYNTDEHTVDGYLYFYDPVRNVIIILNNGLPIITRQGGQQQSYNWATLHEGTIYINHATCMNKHVLSQPQTLISQIYTWKLFDAIKFIK